MAIFPKSGPWRIALLIFALLAVLAVPYMIWGERVAAFGKARTFSNISARKAMGRGGRRRTDRRRPLRSNASACDHGGPGTRFMVCGLAVRSQLSPASWREWWDTRFVGSLGRAPPLGLPGPRK